MTFKVSHLLGLCKQCENHQVVVVEHVVVVVVLQCLEGCICSSDQRGVQSC